MPGIFGEVLGRDALYCSELGAGFTESGCEGGPAGVGNPHGPRQRRSRTGPRQEDLRERGGQSWFPRHVSCSPDMCRDGDQTQFRAQQTC